MTIHNIVPEEVPGLEIDGDRVEYYSSTVVCCASLLLVVDISFIYTLVQNELKK